MFGKLDVWCVLLLSRGSQRSLVDVRGPRCLWSGSTTCPHSALVSFPSSRVCLWALAEALDSGRPPLQLNAWNSPWLHATARNDQSALHHWSTRGGGSLPPASACLLFPACSGAIRWVIVTYSLKHRSSLQHLRLCTSRWLPHTYTHWYDSIFHQLEYVERVYVFNSVIDTAAI